MAENTTYLVDVDAGGEHKTFGVTAAKLAYDERFYPGFIQLRDENGDLAALVQADPGHLLMIRRADSDPYVKHKQEPGVHVTVQGEVPTPAQLAALQERIGKAARP